MFCTGGIRCEKFAPYLKKRVLKKFINSKAEFCRYLEEIPEKKSLWEGECFVFDERITVDEELKKGKEEDLEFRNKAKIK